MKVSFGGRVRKINEMPTNIGEFRHTVQSKFLNCRQEEEEAKQPDEIDKSVAMSLLLDDSDLYAGNPASDPSFAAKLFDKEQEGEKNAIDFQNSVCFYEDSEGDFNVLSEDEDLADAATYVQEHNQKALKCSIVTKQFFQGVLRHE